MNKNSILFTDPASLGTLGFNSSTGDVDDIACIIYMSQKLQNKLIVVICDDNDRRRYTSFCELIGNELKRIYGITILTEAEFSAIPNMGAGGGVISPGDNPNIYIHAPILDVTAQQLSKYIGLIDHVITQGDNGSINFKNSAGSRAFIAAFEAAPAAGGFGAPAAGGFGAPAAGGFGAPAAGGFGAPAAGGFGAPAAGGFGAPAAGGFGAPAAGGFGAPAAGGFGVGGAPGPKLVRFDTNLTNFIIPYAQMHPQTHHKVREIYEQYFKFVQKKSFGTALGNPEYCQRLYSDTGNNGSLGNGMIRF